MDKMKNITSHDLESIEGGILPLAAIFLYGSIITATAVTAVADKKLLE